MALKMERCEMRVEGRGERCVLHALWHAEEDDARVSVFGCIRVRARWENTDTVAKSPSSPPETGGGPGAPAAHDFRVLYPCFI